MKSLNSLPYQIGIVGTFDVENYGDLLFPIIAERQLRQRLENVDVVPFSPNAVSRDLRWPMDVYSTDTIKDRLPFLSGLLVGGGQIVRFDKGYPVAVNPNIDLPIDYWLMPAFLGTIIGKPVIWNAVGAWTGSPVPSSYTDVLKATLSASALVAVRDEASRTHLDQVGSSAIIEQIPDTAFSLSALWPNKGFSKDYIAWREKSGLKVPYVILQADKYIESHFEDISNILLSLDIKTVVILPVCRCHGDDSYNFHSIDSFDVVRSDWLDPVLTCEVISHSSLIIASSLHACITAICYGIACVRIDSFNHFDRKFEMINGFNNICRLNEKDRIVNLYRNKGSIDPKAVAYADLLEQYWDRVAEIISGWGILESGNAASTMLPLITNFLKNINVAGSDPNREAPEKKRAIWNLFN